MSRQEFLESLRSGLAGLPQDDIEERVAFYSEMIDDRMEEGLSEQEAVDGIGSVDEIVSQTVADIPLAKLVKEKIAPKKRVNAWIIVLLVLGSPMWLLLLLVAFSVIFTACITWWTIVIAFWSTFLGFVCGAFAGALFGVSFMRYGDIFPGLAAFGSALISAGLAIFMFFISLAVTKGMLTVTKKLVLGLKYSFVGKGEA